MKTLHHLTAFIASLLLLQAPQAFGLAADYEPGASISHPDTWPPRLAGVPFDTVERWARVCCRNIAARGWAVN